MRTRQNNLLSSASSTDESFIEKNSIVIAETGSLFQRRGMLMPEGATFIGQTFFGSIGYTIGATLGAGMAARDRRVVLLLGTFLSSDLPGPLDNDPEPPQAHYLLVNTMIYNRARYHRSFI